MTVMPPSEPTRALPWVVVLAGGEGRRLGPLTAALYGRPVPKQFAVLDGSRSLLQNTLVRALALTCPERVLVVVNARYRLEAEEHTCEFKGVRLVTQPMSGGTALGMLLPLLLVADEDPDASVVYLPSDHHFSHPDRFVHTVSDVLADPTRGDHVVLLGAEPSAPETDFGWVVPAREAPREGGLGDVRLFAEKPEPRVARHLLASGGLLSTFVTVGSARGFRAAFDAHLPRLTRALAGAVQHRRWQALKVTFLSFGGASFSRDVLERMRNLKVARLPPCGWHDLGTPARVLGVFPSVPQLRKLQTAIARAESPLR